MKEAEKGTNPEAMEMLDRSAISYDSIRHGPASVLQQYYASKIPGRKALGARFLNLRKFWVRDSYFCPLRGMSGVLLLGQFFGAWVPGFLNLGNLLGQESKNPESCSRSFAVDRTTSCTGTVWVQSLFVNMQLEVRLWSR